MRVFKIVPIVDESKTPFDVESLDVLVDVDEIVDVVERDGRVIVRKDEEKLVESIEKDKCFF